MASSANVWTPRDSVPIVTTDSSVVSEIFTAVAGQVDFTLTQFSYKINTGSLLIIVNGAMLDPFLEFDETSNTTFQLTAASTAGDKILAIGFIGAINNVANTYYLGPAAVEPTVNARGDTLSASDEGVTYWNTVTKDLWLYNGTTWILAASSSPTSANLVNIADTGLHYNATEVESALAELASVATGEGASIIGLEDPGSIFNAATNVEAALQELGSNSAGEGASIIAVQDATDYFKETSVESVLQGLGAYVDYKESEASIQVFGDFYATTTSVSSLSISVPTIAVRLGNKTQIVTAGSFAPFITTSGAGGLDTGTEANSTWYWFYIIYNPVTTAVSSLLSISTTPTLPSGYTYSILVGAVYNDAGGDFVAFYQKGKRVMWESAQVLTNGTAIAATAINLVTTFGSIEGDIRDISGYATINNNTGGSAFCSTELLNSASIGNVGIQHIGGYGVTGGNVASGTFDLLTKSSQFFYKNNVANVQTNIFITGWVWK
jgi:hypothetical protein